MKVLYLFLDGTRSPGVIRKVKSKIRFLNEAGIEAEGIFMNRAIREFAFNQEERITYLPLRTAELPYFFNRRFIRNWKSWFAARAQMKLFYQTLSAEVAKHKFDIILFRYPLSNQYLLRFMKMYPGKVVFEHNSKELVEMEMGRDANLIMADYIKAEKKYAPQVLASALALTGVGRAVTQYQVERCKRRGIPHAVVPNGIDVNAQPLRTAPVFDGKHLQVVFVTGSPSPWVGIDLLLNGLANYHGKVEVKVDIVGPIKPELQEMAKQLGVEQYITFTGEKSGKELDAFFDKAHVALGTLAMHRVELPEHSSLKVLEYSARGIPFVITYEEINFSGLKEFSPFYEQQDYNGKSINIGRLVTFAETVLRDPEHPSKMRAIAQQHFDFSVKMNQLIAFLHQLKSGKQ